MKKIKLFSHVRLADGREGDVMEIFGDQEAFLVDLSTPDIAVSLPDDWCPIVKQKDIKRVMWEPTD